MLACQRTLQNLPSHRASSHVQALLYPVPPCLPHQARLLPKSWDLSAAMASHGASVSLWPRKTAAPMRRHMTAAKIGADANDGAGDTVEAGRPLLPGVRNGWVVARMYFSETLEQKLVQRTRIAAGLHP